MISYSFAKQHHILYIHNTIYMTDKTKPDSLNELNRYGIIATISLISDDEFQAKLAEQYGQGNVDKINDEINDNIDLSELVQEIPQDQDLLEQENDAPIIKMINTLITQAIRENASDIHIELFEKKSLVRFRIDGILKDVISIPQGLHAAIVSRLKIMSDLDIAEKRLPQDGRIGLKIAGKNIDVRLSSLPTAYGERIVMRLLERNLNRLNLSTLGMNHTTLNNFNKLLNLPHGIVLVTGPTGSGKTTSLYAGLLNIDAKKINIMTVEDPIEYELPNINQTQVNSKIELSFARVLRSILRQDPDVIMIGEIRDVETAQIAIQAALTGHLVLATLHTNTATSAITRLIDMGIEPFLLSSTICGVLAQRLVRKLCDNCKQINADGVWRAVGCSSCNNTGYLGRTGIHELLMVNDIMRSKIHNNENELDIEQYAQSEGMLLMSEDAKRLIMSGITSVEEVARVCKD
ncbi:MAG: type secretion system ATPase GspE [Pseudomonadota bacterium]|jgi:general secretion pathway protein E